MQLAITNLSPTDDLNLPYLEKVVRAGATIVLNVAQYELSKMVDLQQAVADGLAEYQVTPSAFELTSGILSSGAVPLNMRGYSLSNFRTSASIADTDLDLTQVSTVVGTFTFVRKGAPADAAHIITELPAAAHTYLCEIGVRITIWATATPTVAGNIELIVDAVLATDASGTVTSVTLQAVPSALRVPDAGALAAAAATMAGSAAATFTVLATEPAGVACSARCKIWINNYELLA